MLSLIIVSEPSLGAISTKLWVRTTKRGISYELRYIYLRLTQPIRNYNNLIANIYK